MENSPETQVVPTDWQVVSSPMPPQGEPEHIEPDRAPMSIAQMADRQRADESLSDLGEIEAAVLKRNKISVGQAAGYFAQIIAAAELGGASWETRLKAACRKGEK